jgi:hypothetical protein
VWAITEFFPRVAQSEERAQRHTPPKVILAYQNAKKHGRQPTVKRSCDR